MNGIYLASVGGLANDLLTWVEDKANFLIQFLPTSPFKKAMNLIGNIPYIEEINWFIPIDDMVLVLMYWGTAITLYYGYMIILRWVKAIE